MAASLSLSLVFFDDVAADRSSRMKGLRVQKWL